MTGLGDFRREVAEIIRAEWNPDRYLTEIHEGETTAGGPPAGLWQAKLQAHRLVAPHWPAEYGGRDLPLSARLIVTEELVEAGIPGPGNPIGIGWAGPALLEHGTEEQRKRYLERILDGSEVWCQLFSEPNAGSDLAALTTRADRDGDEFVINGQKIWSSFAHLAAYGILLARTDPEAPKHRGLTYFVIDMNQPGIDIRRIRQMTGEDEFCEVFFTDARVSAGDVVGDVDEGWRVAVTTLLNERMNLSTGYGVLWGSGPSFSALWQTITFGGAAVGRRRQTLADLYARSRVLKFMRANMADALAQGRTPGHEAAVQKLLADRFGQEITAAALAETSGSGLLWHDPDHADAHRWEDAFLFSRALTIGGGTEEIQLNILGERALGLPGEPERA